MIHSGFVESFRELNFLVLLETTLDTDTLNLLLVAFYVDSWWGTTATTSIFIAAAITDWLDGYLARKVLSLYTILVLLYVSLHYTLSS